MGEEEASQKKNLYLFDGVIRVYEVSKDAFRHLSSLAADSVVRLDLERIYFPNQEVQDLLERRETYVVGSDQLDVPDLLD